MSIHHPQSPPRLLAAIVMAGLLFASGLASADVTTYSKEARFEAAAGDVTNYTIPEGDGSGAFEARPYILGPLGFSTYQHFTHPYLMDDGAYGATTYLALRGIPGVNLAADTQVDGVYALGFDIGTYDGADTITVTINFGQAVGTFNTVTGAGVSQFFGIVSTDPITQISFTAQTGTEIDVLDFKVGTVAAVPEPASMTMALAGLGVIGLIARRRKAVRA